MPDCVALAIDGATASVALAGAEPRSWRVGGRELLWHGDPAHWDERAPILFPVVGASAGGMVRIGGENYPMPRHGFARTLPFGLAEQGADCARLRLEASLKTGRHYPFAFRLEVAFSLAAHRLALRFAVSNLDERPLPYGLGFHPGFRWPFDGGRREDYRLVFERPPDPRVPDVTADGLLRPGARRAPFKGRALTLRPSLFEAGALVLRHAGGGPVRFEAPSGRAIVLDTEDFPHLTLWTKPAAPFLCIEPWAGEPDADGFAAELAARASTRLLAPGATAEHAATLRFEDR
jgi:galactose mutarotase-like enzyme